MSHACTPILVGVDFLVLSIVHLFIFPTVLYYIFMRLNDSAFDTASEWYFYTHTFHSIQLLIFIEAAIQLNYNLSPNPNLSEDNNSFIGHKREMLHIHTHLLHLNIID